MNEMVIPYYHVAAFTNRAFGGNPAGVCPLQSWLPDETMQSIAAENALSETAFFVPHSEGGYWLRWFTPTTEVDLCGHATLAAAHVLWRHLGATDLNLAFHTKSGTLWATQDSKGRIALDFPSRPPEMDFTPFNAAQAFYVTPSECLKARDYLFVFDSEETVRNLNPDMALLAGWDTWGIIVSAPGNEVDFVSRFFAPRAGVNEDPVTGSAHCTLIPYWTVRLNKTEFHARQISARGGDLFCQARGTRVTIAGHAQTFLTGNITI